MLDLEWDLINVVQFFVQENLFYLILSACLEILKPCGYFLRIKKTQGSLKLLREDFLTKRVATLLWREMFNKISNPQLFIYDTFFAHDSSLPIFQTWINEEKLSILFLLLSNLIFFPDFLNFFQI